MQREVFGCVECELESHVLQCLCDDDARDELHASSHSVSSCHRGLCLFLGGDVELRVHYVAVELEIATVLYGEGLERNDG